MILESNKYENKLRSRFNTRFEVELFENYTGDPDNPIAPCLSCRIGIQGPCDYYPCETFQIRNDDHTLETMTNVAKVVYYMKCYSLWIRTQNDLKLK